MINIFYNKNGLNDILVIKVINKFSKDGKFSTTKKDDYLITKIDDEISSISISNVSKKIELNEGYLKWNKQINDFVKKITNIDIEKYNEKNFIIGKIINCKKIENTHLHLCKVLIDESMDPIQIVCGAKNAKENINVVVAMIGTIMPNGMLITKGKLQGHESNGMLCSEKELFNKDIQSSGIIELSNVKVGSEFTNHFNNI